MAGSTFLWIIIPLLVMEVSFRGYAVIDILKPQRNVILISKKWWVMAVAFIQFGWVIYLLAGRVDEDRL